MKEWILILKLLGQDVDTGEIDWHEAIRAENISLQVCVENLVDILNTLQDEGIQHEVYCTTAEAEKIAKEKEDNEKVDK